MTDPAPPPRPPRYRTDKRRYRADTVHAVQVLIEGTTLSQREIAAKVGISQERVSAWARRRGWRRRSDAPVANAAAPVARATPARRLRDLARRAEALADRLRAEWGEAASPGASPQVSPGSSPETSPGAGGPLAGAHAEALREAAWDVRARPSLRA